MAQRTQTDKNQTGVGRSPEDYARQQDDIRAGQVFGESSLDRGADRQHHTSRPVTPADRQPDGTTSDSAREDELLKEDPIKPKNERGYDIAPTATNVKL